MVCKNLTDDSRQTKLLIIVVKHILVIAKNFNSLVAYIYKGRKKTLLAVLLNY